MAAGAAVHGSALFNDHHLQQLQGLEPATAEHAGPVVTRHAAAQSQLSVVMAGTPGDLVLGDAALRPAVLPAGDTAVATLQQASSAEAALHSAYSHQPLSGGPSGLELQRHSQPIVSGERLLQQAHPHSLLGSRLLHSLALLRPAASDPLVQPHSRLRPPDAQQTSRAWAAPDSGAPALTRQDLCSDSVSSAARLDLLNNLQRSASAASSGSGSSHMGRSNSSRSSSSSDLNSHPDTVAAGSGALVPVPSSVGNDASAAAQCCAQHSQPDPYAAHALDLSNAMDTEQCPQQQHVQEQGHCCQRPPTACPSGHLCGPSVAVAGAHPCGDSKHGEQGCSSSTSRDGHYDSAAISLHGGVDAASGPSDGSCNASTCRRTPKASPFLRYNFAAALNS